MNINIDWEYFENLWEAAADQYDYFELAKQTHPGMTPQAWDRAWQYTTINNEDFTVAKQEFIIAINQSF
jgi:hypothetical protein